MQIENLIKEWDIATDRVIRFCNPGVPKIRKLFKLTFEILDKYSKENLVPKTICSLLFEINDFEWWVTDLKETPLHYRHKEITSIICEFRKYFRTRDANVESILDMIERL